MEDTKVKYSEIKNVSAADAEALFQQAKDDMAADMKAREIGALLWDNAAAGFHYPPSVMVSDASGADSSWVIHGIYRVDDKLYLIGPKVKVTVDDYYRKGIDVKPVVVRLSEADAAKDLGDPDEARGFTTRGTVQEWLTVADCYFEALNLDNNI